MRSEFKSATQIYVNPIIFWITANIEKWSFFCIPGPDDQNRWNRKNCPKFFHRVIFAFWIQICNPNLCKSHTFWNTANIEKWPFFALWPKLKKRKIAQNSFMFFALWMAFFAYADLMTNPNLCKSYILNGNFENPFFANLMTKNDEIGKIARNSFIG